VNPIASSVSAATVLEAIDAAGLTHVVTVPDTHQMTLLALLELDGRRPVLRPASEDDVLGICSGLWMAGQRPLAVIQQLGLFAATNALRWVHHDARIPLPILAGLFGRDPALAVADDPRSAVRLCTPLLDALQIPWSLIEGPEQAGEIARALSAPSEPRGIHVVLLGAPTA
jgi:sulfopyruvate decarboxylase TPP-binding subunit